MRNFQIIIFTCFLISSCSGNGSTVKDSKDTIPVKKNEQDSTKSAWRNQKLNETEVYVYTEVELLGFLDKLQFTPDSLLKFFKYKNQKPDFEKAAREAKELEDISLVQFYSMFQRVTDDSLYNYDFNHFLSYEKFPGYTRFYISTYWDGCCNLVYILHFDSSGVKKFEDVVWKTSARDGTTDSFSTYPVSISEKRIEIKSNHGYFNEDFSKFEEDEKSTVKYDLVPTEES